MKLVIAVLLLLLTPGPASAFMFCLWAAQNNDVPWSWAESGSDAVITIQSEMVLPNKSAQIAKFFIKNNGSTVKTVEAFPNRTGTPAQYTWTDTNYTSGDVYTVVPVSRVDHVHYGDCQ